jgi:hypothetical protein
MPNVASDEQFVGVGVDDDEPGLGEGFQVVVEVRRAHLLAPFDEKIAVKCEDAGAIQILL